ncbi:MAG TPA: bifunctional [glutamate--ammonia ligase]-adenylyl-L-tyrosine phosphorylase/[glutamate--ammonia-ligase] adenylyltransferase [Burkholderiales bacterium]
MSEPIQKIALSRYAARMLAAHPELSIELAAPQPFAREEMARALAFAPGESEPDFKRRLRRLRHRVLLRVMARDLAGRGGLDEVCVAMSDLAELALEAGVRYLGCDELVVVGMGKLGGRELNVSSDIDLVFLAPGNSEKLLAPAKKLIQLLADVTADGFCFRVDMRLRPYGEAGPLVCDFDFLDAYFVTQGREWERYAWIKARAITGGEPGGAQHEALARIVRPFVFRKYLDYATLAAMRGLHAEVRRDVERRERAGDVKLGPGGIREIEFVAQALQLIRGGRDPELTVRPTLQVLDLLCKKNLLPDQAKKDLSAAYVFLRNVEHRLQYLDDAQRHDLPQDAEDRARIASMAGFPSWDAFTLRLQEVRAAVSRHFEAIFAESTTAPEPWPAHPRLEALRASQRYALLPTESKRRLDLLIPALARAAAATPDAVTTLARGVDLVEAIASRAAYLALLAENPRALERVARLIGASSWAAEFVSRHPLLLDELLDDRQLHAPFDIASFAATLKDALARFGDDTERCMNLMRELHQAQVFRLLAQDLAGLLTVERLSDHLSALADVVLETTLERVWTTFSGKHRQGAPHFAVIGYGKLGGKELGYASDLDIIFLYDDADERAAEVYARIAQRINGWLSTRTSAGLLFETDLRLRPSGASGLLVSSLEGFERYQDKDAWVWEHQALTRARYCAGDRQVGAVFEGIRDRILRRSRESESLKKEILAMREKMLAAHPNSSGLFDVKHDRGGMIDIEFAVQFLILAFSSQFPALTQNLGNIALLDRAAGLGLIERPLAEQCREAYREFRRVQHALRLNGAAYARVAPQQLAAQRGAVLELWRAVISP